MGALVSLCRGEGQPEEEEESEEQDVRREAWAVESMTVDMQWGYPSPWECPKCGALWHRQ